jgi:glutamate racemase
VRVAARKRDGAVEQGSVVRDLHPGAEKAFSSLRVLGNAENQLPGGVQVLLGDVVRLPGGDCEIPAVDDQFVVGEAGLGGCRHGRPADSGVALPGGWVAPRRRQLQDPFWQLLPPVGRQRHRSGRCRGGRSIHLGGTVAKRRAEADDVSQQTRDISFTARCRVAELLVAYRTGQTDDLVGRRAKVKGHAVSVNSAPVAVETEAPIGIFDSGFGGLTVARAVIDQLPHEDIVYLGDTARSPYGEQPISQVREYALECLDHLLAQGVKALVIACNSASAAVLRDARERYPVPVVEVILPAARRAVSATRSGRVGVICTEATATSQAYDDAFAVAPQVQLHTAACPRFVSFVEAGITGGAELLWVARDYLEPLQNAEIDTLILGCTHYPLLTGAISYVLGDAVSLVSSADECAKELFAVLTRQGLTHDQPRYASHRFLTTGNPDAFEGIGSRLMGGLVVDVEQFARSAGGLRGVVPPGGDSARSAGGLRGVVPPGGDSA